MKKYLLFLTTTLLLPTPDQQADELMRNPAKLEALLDRVQACNNERDGPKKSHANKKIDAQLDATFSDTALQTPITCAHTNQPLATVLTKLAQQANISLSVDEAVRGTVPVCVAQGESLGVILRNLLAGRKPLLAAYMQGAALRIAPRITLREELRQQPHHGVPQERATVSIQHRPVDEQLLLRLERAWRDCGVQCGETKGFFHADERQRCIVIEGGVARVQLFQELVATLDQPRKQVQLRVRVLLADDTFMQGAGIDFQAGVAKQGGAGTGFTWAGVGDVVGRALPWTLHLFPAGSMAKICELPIVFGGSDLATRRLNIILNAAEQRKQVKTLLQPTLLVEDGQQAELLDGRVVPVESMVEEAVEGRVRNVRSAQYKEVGMQVRVKPTVHDDGRRIFIELNVENSQVLPDAGRYPTIATTRTKNKVLLRSGETVLIGGLLSSRTDLDRHGIPWLSSIPGIGWLFRGWRREKQRTQLLVMVTASTPHQ